MNFQKDMCINEAPGDLKDTASLKRLSYLICEPRTSRFPVAIAKFMHILQLTKSDTPTVKITTKEVTNFTGITFFAGPCRSGQEE